MGVSGLLQHLPSQLVELMLWKGLLCPFGPGLVSRAVSVCPLLWSPWSPVSPFLVWAIVGEGRDGQSWWLLWVARPGGQEHGRCPELLPAPQGRAGPALAPAPLRLSQCRAGLLSCPRFHRRCSRLCSPPALGLCPSHPFFRGTAGDGPGCLHAAACWAGM